MSARRFTVPAAFALAMMSMLAVQARVHGAELSPKEIGELAQPLVQQMFATQCPSLIDGVLQNENVRVAGEVYPFPKEAACRCASAQVANDPNLAGMLSGMIAASSAGGSLSRQARMQQAYVMLRFMTAVFTCMAPGVQSTLDAIARLDTPQGARDSERAGSVQRTYEQAELLVRAEIQAYKTRRALGQNATLPEDAAGWIRLLNPQGTSSPAGAPAFSAYAASTATSGSIGVEVSGRASSEDLQVTLRRPAYLGLVEETKTVTFDTP